MPGKAAKITITERQHDILLTLRNAVTAPSHLRQRAAVILLAFDGLRNEDIAERLAWDNAKSDGGDDAGPGLGTASLTWSAARPTPTCAGPSKQSSPTNPAPALPASSPRSKSPRSSRSPASPPRSRAGPSPTGRPTNWPTRSSSGASSRRSRRPR